MLNKKQRRKTTQNVATLNVGDRVSVYYDKKVQVKEYEPASIGIGIETTVQDGETGLKAFTRISNLCKALLAKELQELTSYKQKRRSNHGKNTC